MAVGSHCSRPDRGRLRYGRREPVAVGRRYDDHGLPGDNHRHATVFDNLYEPRGLDSVEHPGQPRHVHDKPDTHDVDYDRDVVDDFNLFHHNVEFYNHYNNNCSSDHDVNVNDDDFYDDNDCPDRPHYSPC